jgi:hypothetical protein
MNTNHRYHVPDVPSHRKELLASIVGDSIQDLVRYSWWSSAEDGAECGILKESDFFSLGPGPLLIKLKSGRSIGFSDDSSNNSLLVWMEADGHGNEVPNPLAQDSDLNEIKVNNSRFNAKTWTNLLNKTIFDVVILRQKTTEAKYADLANEAGVVIVLEGDEHVVLSHGLHDNSDDFALIKLNDILPSISEQLAALSLRNS